MLEMLAEDRKHRLLQGEVDTLRQEVVMLRILAAAVKALMDDYHDDHNWASEVYYTLKPMLANLGL